MGTETHGRAIVAMLRWKNRKGEAMQYPVTELDFDTLVRSCAHEGKPHGEVVRCLLQRFAWIYPIYPQLEDFVRAYVQPINPRWHPKGSKHKREVSRLLRKGQHGKAADEQRRAKRRVEYSEQPLNTIEGRYHTTVKAVLADTGSWDHLKGAIHYRAGRGSDNTEGLHLAEDFAEDRDDYFVVDSGHGYKAGVNWFFGVGKSETLELATELYSDEDEERKPAEQQKEHDQVIGDIHEYLPSMSHPELQALMVAAAEQMAKTAGECN